MHTIFRVGVPSKFDQYPHGTTCKTESSHDGNYELYIQFSKNEEEPKWELIGSFNEDSPESYVSELISIRLMRSKV